MATDGDQGRVFLFGGRGKKGFLSDLWYFSPGRGGWRQLSGREDGPRARSGASLVWDKQHARLYLFGGWWADKFGKNHFLRELWTWSDEDGWGRHFFKEGPCGRAWHAAATDKAGDMLLVGGYGGKGHYYLADVWRLDGGDLHFTRLITDGRTGIAGNPELMVFGKGQGMFLFGRVGWRVNTGTAAYFMMPRQDAWVRWSITGMPPADYSFCVPFPSVRGLVAVRVFADAQPARARAWLVRTESRMATVMIPDTIPRRPRGMTCSPHPDGGPRSICFGGVSRSELSADTWLVELRQGRSR